MVSAPWVRVCDHGDVEIAAALVAFVGLVVAWVACPTTKDFAPERAEERAA
jgi:hypothetical protein